MEFIEIAIEVFKDQISFLDACLLFWVLMEYKLNGKLLDRLFVETGNSAKICTMLNELVQRGRMQ